MNLEEAKECLKKCIQELKTRFLLKIGDINCKMVNKDGVSQFKLE
jgi:20S proteasome subunit beta 4